MRVMRRLVIVLLAPLALITSCADGDQVFDQIVENEQRGAILRTVNLISNELPIGVADASFSAELEVQDKENGGLLESLDVFVGFRDNTVEDGAPDLDVPEALWGNIPASEFEIGEFGLPRVTVNVPLTELLSFTGVNESDLFGGDQFTIRFELKLTDGRSFSNDDNTGTLTGSFFNSPFLYSPTVICPVAEDAFVGDYLLQAPVSPIGGVPIWDEQVVSLSIGATSTQRVFEAIYLGALGIGNGPNSFTFDLICQTVTVPGDQASGLACGGNSILQGPAADGSVGSYDAADDSLITIVFDEDYVNGCGGPVQQTFTLTKQ